MKKKIVMFFVLAISMQMYGMRKQGFKFEKMPEKEEFLRFEKKEQELQWPYQKKFTPGVYVYKSERDLKVRFDKDKGLYNTWYDMMGEQPKAVKRGRLGVLYDALNALNEKTKVHTYFDVYKYNYPKRGWDIKEPLSKDRIMYEQTNHWAPLAIVGNLKKPIYLITLETAKPQKGLFFVKPVRWIKIKNKDVPNIKKVKIFYKNSKGDIEYVTFSGFDIARGKFSEQLKDLIYKIYTFNPKSYQKVGAQRKEQLKTQRSKKRLYDIEIVTES